MKCRVIDGPFEDNEAPEVVHVEFNVDKLLVTIRHDGYRIDVEFNSPEGFRVLDEGDLNDFWSTCSSKNGWLYEILSSGWFEQEKRRDGFLSGQNEKLREYLVIGCNFCVGVFDYDDPSIIESIR